MRIAVVAALLMLAGCAPEPKGDPGALFAEAESLRVAGRPQRALTQYEAAARAGHAQAQLTLAGFYRLGEGGVDADVQEATRWYRAAASSLTPKAAAGDAEAAAALGFLYAEGLGVPVDTAEALRLFEQGVGAGHPKALLGLGVYHYRRGDFGAAAPLFERAAAHEPQAAVLLAGMLAAGRGLAPDVERAFRLLATTPGAEARRQRDAMLADLRRAAAQGHPEASRHLNTLEAAGLL